MRSNRLVQLLVAALLAALVLGLALWPLHGSRGRQPVITHEIHDLIATLQAPLEGGGATPRHSNPAGEAMRLILAVLGAAGVAGAIWTVRVRRRQQRDRSNPS